MSPLCYGKSDPVSRDVLWLGLLAFPVAGGFATVLFPALPEATVSVVGLALVIAAVNAFSEEVFWRGLFVRMSPGRKVLGLLYPAAWFSLWHISPSSVFRSTWVLVVAAAYLGLVYGWIAWRTAPSGTRSSPTFW